MFDAHGFLRDFFRGPAELVAFVRSYGFDPPRDDTALKWFRRQTLPAPWGYFLIALLEIDRGAPVSISKYIGGGNGKQG